MRELLIRGRILCYAEYFVKLNESESLPATTPNLPGNDNWRAIEGVVRAGRARLSETAGPRTQLPLLDREPLQEAKALGLTGP
jgi:hypothetical protein